MTLLQDDGLVTVASLVNTAEAGDMPVYKLKAEYTQPFSELTAGVTRQYLARGADEQVDMLIRISADNKRPKIGQFAVLKDYSEQENENGDQYRITNVQAGFDEDNLRTYSLQLMRIEENYDCISK